MAMILRIKRLLERLATAPRSWLAVVIVVGLELLQLLLPIGAVFRPVVEAAFGGGAPFAPDETDVYAMADFVLELGVAASSVRELPQDVQDDGLSVRQQLPAIPP
jgi:hypothetical protein